MLSIGEITKFCSNNTSLERVTWQSSSSVDFYLDFDNWIFGIDSIGVHDHEKVYEFQDLSEFIDFLVLKGVPVSISDSKYEQLRLF